MGVMVDVGVLTPQKKLTKEAINAFIKDIRDILEYGSESIPNPPYLKYGDPIIEKNHDELKATEGLEDPSKFPDFHKDILGLYEEIAASHDAESNFSLLPAIADPIALAASFGINLPPKNFPSGLIPYFTGAAAPAIISSISKVDPSNPEVAARALELSLPATAIPKIVDKAKPPAPPIPPQPKLSLPEPSGAAEVKWGTQDSTTPPEALPDLQQTQIASATASLQTAINLVQKMPEIAGKIANIDKVLSEAVATVRSSKPIGPTPDGASLKKVYEAVFSRKIVQCAIASSMAKTLGSSPGAATASIHEKCEPNIKPLEKPLSDPPSKTSPNKRVKDFANTIVNTSYGSDPVRYTKGLFYFEDMLRLNTNNLNIRGVPLSGGNLPINQEYIDAIYNQTLSNSIQNTPQGEERTIKNSTISVEKNTGFFNYAMRVAQNASSCGLVARACLYAGGCNNQFFLSEYPSGTIMSGLILIGLMRNYRWIGPGGLVEAIVNDKVISTKSGHNIPIAKAINEIEYGGWEIDIKDNRIVSQTEWLTEYLKPFRKRAAIGPKELLLIKKGEHPDTNEFPALEAGDFLLLNYDKPDQHVMVVTQAREAGFNLINNDVLNPAIRGIEGGETDDGNRQTFKEWAATDSGEKIIKASEDLEKAIAEVKKQSTFSKAQALINKEYSNKILKSGENFYSISVREPLKGEKGLEPGQKFVVNQISVTEVAAARRPTAVLGAAYDRGSIIQEGFAIGSSVIISSDGSSTPNHLKRKIGYIFKAKNYLDPLENAIGNDENILESEKAAFFMDENPSMKEILNKLEDPARLRELIRECYTGVVDQMKSKK